MKINAIVGNPPYQINDGSGASDDAANPIYQVFVKTAKQICPNYFSLIMPSKWMVGGKVALKSFRKEMMNDTRLSLLSDFEDSGYCFNGQHIDGGICYFLWDSSHHGKMKYTYRTEAGHTFITKRYLSDGSNEMIIRDSRRSGIIEKATSIGQSFSTIVSSRKPFGIPNFLFNDPSRYPDSNMSQVQFSGSVKIYGVKGIKGGAKRTSAYIDPCIITKMQNAVSMWKIFFPKSYSTNAINPPATIVAMPGEICTETFLVVGPFDNEIEQANCNKYIDTRFFKTLLFFGKGTMNVTKDVFCFVPLQDFSSSSDIDWTKSVAEIDRQLYAKYRLADEEIDFIESMIKPM